MAITRRGVSALGTGTTSVTVSEPASTASTDVLYAIITDRATTGSSAAPTGWTRICGGAGTGGRIQCFRALKSGLSGTSWSFTGLTTRAAGVIVGYYGVNLTTPENGTPTGRRNASTASGTTAVTTTVANTKVLGGFASFANGCTWTNESTATAGALTEFFDSANGTSQSIALADRDKAATGTTGASSATMSTTTNNGGILVCINPAVAPTVTTQMVTSQADTTATGNGNVTADGGATVTERGVCWGTSTGPTTAGDHAAAAAGGTGAFTCSITGLSAGQLYYGRAYAINAVGTSYGGEIQFYASNAGVYKDNFNRANASPIDGDWVTVSGLGNIVISSNAVNGVNASADNAVYNNAFTPDAAQYAQLKCTDATFTSEGPCVRISTSAADFYHFEQYDATNCKLYKYVSGTPTELLNISHTYAQNDIFGLKISSDHILTPVINGADQTTYDDSASPLASGRVGFLVYSNGTASGDDWEGGNLPTEQNIVGAGSIISGEIIGALVLAVSIFCSGITSAEAIGQPTISPVSFIVDVGNISSQEAFGQPGISSTVSSSGIASAEALGSGVVSSVVSASGIVSAEAIGLPTVSVGTTSQDIVDAGGIISAETFGQPALSSSISATGIATAEAEGQPAISTVISSSGIASSETLGQPAISSSVVGGSISSGEIIGSPVVSSSIFTTGIVTAESFGSAQINLVVSLSGIPSEEEFGSPAIWIPQEIIGAGNIGSSEAFGLPTIFVPSTGGAPKIIIVDGNLCIYLGGVIYEKI